MQNGSSHDVSVSYSYDGREKKQNRRVKVPDDGKGEGRGLNPIQPAVRVGLEQRLWC